jgi:nitroreductase
MEEERVETVGLLEGMATTRAIRRYHPDPIPDADLATMFFHATRAPSGSNTQPFRFLVLRDGPRARQARELLGRTFREQWQGKRATRPAPSSESSRRRLEREDAAMDSFVENFERTPVVVLALMARYRPPAPREGGSIYPACQNLLLAARALGYGGVMSMWQAAVEDELRAILDIPRGVGLMATTTLGRPVGHHGPVRRRPIAELVYEDAWNQPAAWAVDPPGTHFSRGTPRPLWPGDIAETQNGSPATDPVASRTQGARP